MMRLQAKRRMGRRPCGVPSFTAPASCWRKAMRQGVGWRHVADFTSSPAQPSPSSPQSQLRRAPTPVVGPAEEGVGLCEGVGLGDGRVQERRLPLHVRPVAAGAWPARRLPSEQHPLPSILAVG